MRHTLNTGQGDSAVISYRCDHMREIPVCRPRPMTTRSAPFSSATRRMPLATPVFSTVVSTAMSLPLASLKAWVIDCGLTCSPRSWDVSMCSRHNFARYARVRAPAVFRTACASRFNSTAQTIDRKHWVRRILSLARAHSSLRGNRHHEALSP
jgi:hypothetical protein